MKYSDGQEARMGDRVRLGADADADGVVVCSIDADEYRDENARAQWGYLARGVMIQFPKYGLIHFTEPDPDLYLVVRGDN